MNKKWFLFGLLVLVLAVGVISAEITNILPISPPANESYGITTPYTFNVSYIGNTSGAGNISFFSSVTGLLLCNYSSIGTPNGTAGCSANVLGADGKTFNVNVTVYNSTGGVDISRILISNFTVDLSPPNITAITINAATATTVNVNTSLSTAGIGYNTTDNAYHSVSTCNLSLFNSSRSLVTNVINTTSLDLSNVSILFNNVLSLPANGLYYWNITCTDSAMRTNFSSTYTLTYDNVVPAVTAINSPASGVNLSTGTQVLNATVTDATLGVSIVWFNITNCSSDAINLAAGNLTSSLWNATLTLSTLGECAHTLMVVANDSVGNTNNSVTVSFTVDRTAPTVNLLSPANGSWTADTTPDFIFNFTDALSSTASCTVYVGNTAYGTNTTVRNNTNTTITANGTLTDGTKNWNVTCTDMSGNVGNSTPIPVYLDSTTPHSRINYINNLSSTNATNVRLLTINFTANDTNINTWNLSLFNSTGGLLKNWTSNLTNNVSTSIGDYNATANTTYLVNLTVIDNASNSNTSTFAIIVDTVVPSINSLTFSSITSTSANLAANVTDTPAGVASCTYAGAGSGTFSLDSGIYSATFSELSASTGYTVNITCTDNAGNIKSNTSDFTTLAAASTSSSSSGGGGSSSQQISGQFAQEYWASVVADTPETMDISDDNLGVSEVTFTLSKTVYSPWLKVYRKDSLPNSMSGVGGKVYTYLEITKASSMADDIIKSATIKFDVSKEWLTAQKLTKNQVSLYRYGDNKWVELKTSLISDNTKNTYYSAETSGFSYFAVAQTKTIATAPVATTTPTTPIDLVTEIPETAPTTETTIGTEVTGKSWSWLWIALGVIVIVGLIIWLFAKPEHHRKR